jgi:hypothetical protein
VSKWYLQLLRSYCADPAVIALWTRQKNELQGESAHHQKKVQKPFRWQQRQPAGGWERRSGFRWVRSPQLARAQERPQHARGGGCFEVNACKIRRTFGTNFSTTASTSLLRFPAWRKHTAKKCTSQKPHPGPCTRSLREAMCIMKQSARTV